MGKHFPVVIAAVCLIVVLLVAPHRGLNAEAPDQVAVINFPDVQEVRGSVRLTEPVPASSFVAQRALVSPARISEVNDLTDGGTLELSGFSSLTLGLVGALQGAASEGVVGAVLLPAEPEILENFRNRGALQLALRVEAEIGTADGGLFSSDQVTLSVLFPRYRVFFYNTTPRTAEVALYANRSTS